VNSRFLLCTLGALVILPSEGASDTAPRVQELSAFFSPPPGKSVAIDPSEFLRKDLKNWALAARGFIQATPPRNRCLIINRNDSQEDVRVCKPQPVSFSADQIAKNGTLTWLVNTSDRDDQVELTWQTPHRIGKAVVIGHNIDGNSFPLLILGCSNESSDTGRKLRLQIAGRKDFIVRLPAQDKLIQPQPDPFPNLFIQNGEGQKGGIPTTGVKSLFTMREDKNKKKGQRVDDNLDDPRKLKPRAALDILDNWDIDRRGAFEMDTSFIITNISQPAGATGRCRYTYSGPREDPMTGFLECQKTSEFQWLYLPVTCMRSVLPGKG
jgi:hypothetical protein